MPEILTMDPQLMDEILADDEPDPWSLITRRLEIEDLQSRLVAILSPQDQQLMTLYYGDSETQTRIAEILGTTQQSVSYRLAQLRHRVRDVLDIDTDIDA